GRSPRPPRRARPGRRSCSRPAGRTAGRTPGRACPGAGRFPTATTGTACSARVSAPPRTGPCSGQTCAQTRTVARRGRGRSGRVSAENRRTRGPRPEPGPVTISATPPTDSNATRTAPVKLVYGAKFPTKVASALNTLTTEPPPPPPGPVMISALPSPFTSPAATYTPPENIALYAKKLAASVPSVRNAFTCGPPPAPAPATDRK